MSKFLKFIVHFIVICTILCVVALAVPPFFGVNTVIRDDAAEKSNLPLGSVTYAVPVKTEEIKAGDPILAYKGEEVYRYNVVSVDQENSVGVVVDEKSTSGESINVAIQDYMPKIVITVEFIGYLLIATESIEGLIILGLSVLFLIILYVIAELWKKEPEEYEEYDQDPQPGYVKTKKELKKEEKERQRRLKEEEQRLLEEEKQGRKKEKKSRKEKKIIKTGGFVDEIYEEDFEEEEPARPVTVQTATSEAHELLKKEIAAATAEEPAQVRIPAQEVLKETVVKEEEPELPKAKEMVEEEPQVIRKLAIPVWSAAQLADKAKRDGDAPDIVKDNITKVTLFDYSDIIGEEEEK